MHWEPVFDHVPATRCRRAGRGEDISFPDTAESSPSLYSSVEVYVEAGIHATFDGYPGDLIPLLWRYGIVVNNDYMSKILRINGYVDVVLPLTDAKSVAPFY